MREGKKQVGSGFSVESDLTQWSANNNNNKTIKHQTTQSSQREMTRERIKDRGRWMKFEIVTERLKGTRQNTEVDFRSTDKESGLECTENSLNMNEYVESVFISL